MEYYDEPLLTEDYDEASAFESEDESFAEDPRSQFNFRPLGAGRPMAPLNFSPVSTDGDCVREAVIRTPRGQARIELSKDVPSYNQFRNTTQHIQSAVSRTTTRINALTGSVQVTGRRVDTLAGETRRGLTKVSKDLKGSITKLRKENRTQANSNQLILIILFLQLQKRIDDVSAGNNTAQGSTSSGLDNDALLLVLLLYSMTPQGGESDDNSMNHMLPLFLVLLSGNDRN